MAKQSYYSEKLARYIFREFMLPLVCCTVGFTMLFLLFDLFDVLKDFMEKDAGIVRMVEFFMMRQPERLVMLIPMSFLLAGMYTFSNLSRHSEVTALKASGISLVRTCRYLWVTALVGVAVQGWLLDRVVPTSEKRAQYLEEVIANPDYTPLENKLLAFHAPDVKRDWIFASFSLGERSRGVVVTQFRPNKSRDWELRAEEAQFVPGSGWTFFNGTVSYYDLKGEMLLRKPELFTARTIPELTENPESIETSLSPVAELTISQLWTMATGDQKLPDTTRAACLTTVYERIFWPLSCLVGLLLGVSLTVSHHRSGVFANIGVAVGVMLAYYALFRVAVIVGQKGLLPAWIPLGVVTLAALLYGGWMMAQKR